MKHAAVRVDEHTLERLRRLSGGLPLESYLRSLTLNIQGRLDQEDPLEKRLSRIETLLEQRLPVKEGYTPTLEEKIDAVKKLARDLKLGAHRQAALKLFLERPNCDTIDFILHDLQAEKARGRPMTQEETLETMFLERCQAAGFTEEETSILRGFLEKTPHELFLKILEGLKPNEG